MPASAMSGVIRSLRTTVIRRDGAGLTDGQLLELFIADRDEAAFEALVRRHGPMVLGVCRRLLDHGQDAEDAFQATFLVLVRKATSIVPRERVANWLHGVAYNTALKAKAMNAKRRRRETQVRTLPERELSPDCPTDDLQRLLDRALRGLADRYRVPIILCELEGKSYKEAARQLNLSESAISVRLVRAKKMLAKRLRDHGAVLSAAALAVVLSQSQASASVPASLLHSTVKAASVFGGAKAVSAAVVSTKVAALTKGVLQSMLLTKLKMLTAMIIAATVIGTGASVCSVQLQAAAVAKSAPLASPLPLLPPDEPKALTDQEAIQGTWAVERLDQLNHEPTKEEKAYLQSGQFRLIIRAGKLVYPDQSEGLYTLDPTAHPKRMEITAVADGKKLTAPAIYALQGDNLQICMGRGGDRQAPAAFDITKAAPGTFPTCWTLKRVPEDKTPKRDKSSTTKPEGPAKDEDLIQGRWQAIAGETAQEKLPSVVVKVIAMTFNGNGVSMTRGSESGSATFTLDAKKSPKEIDVAASDGSKSVGIYELDKDRLKLCLVEDKTEPRPTEFAAKGRQVVMVFQRVDPTKPESPLQKQEAEAAKALIEYRLLKEECVALREQSKFQEALAAKLKDELTSARSEVACVLRKVDVAKNTIDVTLAKSTLPVKEMPIATSAKFYLDEKECSINDLKEGMRLSLAFGTEADNGKVAAIRAFSEKADQKK